MIIDTSAILAILFSEEDMQLYAVAIAKASTRRMSAGNLLEASIVVEGRVESSGVARLDALLERAAIEVVPVTVEQSYAARRAWSRYGRGNHPARLNYGDCFAYGLAETTGEPLLFKGDDFSQTNIESAL